MRQRLIQYSLIIALLAIGLLSLVHATENDKANSATKGCVLTVVAINAKAHTVTLKRDDGDTFQTASSKPMKVGRTVYCEVISEEVPERV